MDEGMKGAIYTAVVLAVSGGLVALMGMGAVWLRAKAKDSKRIAILLRVWETAQSVVAHVEVHLRPSFRAAFADGQLTKEEATKLKAEALRLLKEGLGEHGMKELRSALGILGPSLEVYLSGVIERALGVQRKTGTLPPPAPGSSAGQGGAGDRSAPPVP